MNRRAFLLGTTAFGLAGPAGAATPGAPAATPFGPDTVLALARDLASRPYAPRAEVPDAYRHLGYDGYRTIWFDTAMAVWEGEAVPFRMDLFLPGLYFLRPVDVAVVEDGTARPVPFDLALFDRTDQAPDLPVDETVGYSGIRLRAASEVPDVYREFAVFQGASYFRAIGEGLIYGLSARGLALRTADPEGEEFPDFTRFWVERAAPDAASVVVHALLDGPSAAGAYRFELTPGPACRIEVEATLFPRVALDHVGLAPLTSMFLYDQTNRWRFRDFRPAIHDSDGLAMWNGAGERIWRPLANSTTLQVSSFVDVDPKGFGLMQRAQRLADFADLEARYERRPSLWIEPRGAWGEGVVRLVEIPSDMEIYDNVVAYWRPREPLPAGEPYGFAYAMTWFDEASADPAPSSVAPVLDTHLGESFERESLTVAIDLAAHPALDGELATLAATVHVDGAEASGGVLQRNPETGGVRLTFGFDPDDREVVELRAQVTRDGRPASEVWLYRWTQA